MTKRGIVDPWRRVEPVHPAARSTEPQRERIDVMEIDHDADLAIPGQYTLRSAHVAFHITSVRLNVPKDALEVLADCIMELAKLKLFSDAFRGAGIGAKTGRATWNPPAESLPTSTLACEGNTIWFAQAPIDQGMLLLARILRTPEAAGACRKHGIVVMLTT